MGIPHPLDGVMDVGGESLFGTKKNSIFSLLAENAVRKDTLATPAGIEPALPA